MDQFGTLVVAGLGCLFVAYIFNFEGAKTALDRYLGGLDHSAKSHGTEVSRYVVLAFPYVAGALALAFLRILGSALINNLSGLFRGKKKAKPKLKETAVPVAMSAKAAVVAAESAPMAKPPAVCLKPPKPLRPERGVVKVAPAR